MSRIKCSKCGKLAEINVEGRMYCLDCVPKPKTPVIVEETLTNQLVIERHDPKPRPDPPTARKLFEKKQPTKYFKPLAECIEKKKSWSKKIMSFLDDRRPK